MDKDRKDRFAEGYLTGKEAVISTLLDEVEAKLDRPTTTEFGYMMAMHEMLETLRKAEDRLFRAWKQWK
jgi:hypothetical protein